MVLPLRRGGQWLLLMLPKGCAAGCAEVCVLIGFNGGELCERGTSVALFDYAEGNETGLGNRSLIFYDRNAKANVAEAIRKFEARFEVVAYSSVSDLHERLRSHRVDAFYTIKGGARDTVDFQDIATMVHAVFPTKPSEIHGHAYAYVSPWLARLCRGQKGAAVPHIVHLARAAGDLRPMLGIPSDATVFGCYGGKQSFDIDFVKAKVIPHVLAKSKNTFFIFMNIEPFLSDPCVHFLPGTTDVDAKARFIQTADAMLHARKRGETFGLACAEFHAAGRRIITYGRSRERAHIEHAGTDAIVYKNRFDLARILLTFDRSLRADPAHFLRRHSPAAVMEDFKAYLLDPALLRQDAPRPKGIEAKLADKIFYLRRKGFLPQT